MVVVVLQGTLKASTDLKRFGNEFEWVNRGRSNM